MDVPLKNLSGCDVSFLPIVAAFVKQIGIGQEVNRLCGGQSDVSPGLVVEAMVLVTLSGRSPLYRLEDSFAGMDLELLLGEDIPPSKGLSQNNPSISTDFSAEWCSSILHESHASEC
ncbi:DUF4277 domain-containing protein [Thermodesulfobacteriota bacterium]